MKKGPPAAERPTAPAGGPAWRTLSFPLRVRASARDTLRLAAPAAVSRTGILLMMTVDTLLVGRFDARELAYFGLAMPVQMVLMMLAIGLLQGTLILTSQSYGAGRPEMTGAIWRTALLHAAVIGAAFGLAAANGPALLAATGQDPALIAGAQGVLLQFAWGIPGMLLYIASSYFLEGIRRPHPAMVVMLAANVVNALLGWIFVFGVDGLLAPMGAEGAMLAISIVRWLIFLALLVHIATMGDRDRYGIRPAFGALPAPEIRRLGRQLRGLGLPIALALGVETGATAVLLLLAGRLGAGEIAATQVVLQVIQFVFMLAVGMGAATAVRAGIAVGGSDRPALRLAGLTGIGLIACLDLPFALLFALAPETVASLFVRDPAVLAMACNGLRVAAFALLFHGVMGVSLSALRGAGDVWTPFALHAGAFWLVMVPVAEASALALGWGVAGLMTGFLAGVALSATFMALRFHILTRAQPTAVRPNGTHPRTGIEPVAGGASAAPRDDT